MKTKIKVIKDQMEYEAALKQLSVLMDKSFIPGSDDENHIELLLLVLKDYEERNATPLARDPIEAIKFRMEQMNLSNKDLIPYMGSASRVSEVLSGKRKLSISMIRKLHKGLGIPLISLLPEGPDHIAEDPVIPFAQLPLKEMQARGCFGKAFRRANDLKEYAEELVKDFCGKYLKLLESPMHAYLRASTHRRGKRKFLNKLALQVWQICVLKKAEQLSHLPEYKKELINESWMRDLIKLSIHKDGDKLAKDYLEKYGIAFIVEPHFKKTFLDGAAMIYQKRPIIALTLRYKRIDNFWFVLAHELSHLIKHINPKNEEMLTFIDDLDEKEDLDSIELEADATANEALIPNREWKNARTKIETASDVISFSQKLGINPAIVAGRLRHERKNYRIFPNLVSSEVSIL